MLEYDDDALTGNILKTFAEIGNEAKGGYKNFVSYVTT